MKDNTNEKRIFARKKNWLLSNLFALFFIYFALKLINFQLLKISLFGNAKALQTFYLWLPQNLTPIIIFCLIFFSLSRYYSKQVSICKKEIDLIKKADKLNKIESYR